MHRPSPGSELPFRPWAYLGLVTVPLMLAALVTWYVVNGVYLFGDIPWYRIAADALVSSGPLYEPARLLPHPLTVPPYSNQAPSTALFSLVLLLPAGAQLWAIASVAAVFGAVIVIWPRVGPGGVLLLGPVLFAWYPVSSALGWGNVNAFVFLLLAIAWRYQRAAGVAIGLAAAIKLVPILGVAWLLGKRDWRGAAIAIGIPLVATLVVAAWKGPSTITDFITLRLNEYHPAQWNRWDLVDALGVSQLVGYALAAGLGLAAIWRASFSLSVLAMIAAVPALHAHYLTWLLVPLLGVWFPWLLRRMSMTTRSESDTGSSLTTSKRAPNATRKASSA